MVNLETYFYEDVWLIGDEGCGVDIYPNQSSGVLSSVAWGNVLVRQKSGENIRVNDTVDVLIY